jgi:hypothetical protein
MKRQLILVLLTVLAAAVVYLLLTRESRERAARSRGGRVVITPDGKLSVANDARETVTWVARVPRPTNGPAAATPTPAAK